jgi:hypothetical protein
MVADMRSAVTIRKASAYLTSFDAPRPANDSHDSSVSIATPIAEPPSDGEDLSTTRPEMENVTGHDAQIQPDSATPLDKTVAIETKIASAVEDERRAAAQRLELERENWTTEIADCLALRFEQTMAMTIEKCRDDIAGILRPFVSHEVFVRSLAEVTDSLKKGLSGAVAPVIEISAPADLIDKLSGALADRDISIIARETDQLDVVVNFGSTTISTALEAWVAQLTPSQRDI